MHRTAAVLVVLFVAVGCSSETAAPSDGAWVGTITTEGNVTTVINESGSVWGGTATLVEEASIGVESGPDEYMFGFVSAVHATDDRILLIDQQVRVVRAYDLSGAFIGDIGRFGQGPGEYNRPRQVTTDASGRIFVFDSTLARINVYAPSGEVLETWPVQDARCCAFPMYPLAGEAIWMPVEKWSDRSRREVRYGAVAVGPDGRSGEVTWIPDIAYDPITYVNDRGYEENARFAPKIESSPAPDGRLVAGASDRYRFEVLYPDGAKRVVERFWDPVPIPEAQREWWWRFTVRTYRDSNVEIALGVTDMPTHQPAYNWFIPTLSGELWISGLGAAERLPECADDPFEGDLPEVLGNRCWRNEITLDVFDVEGRFLGGVQVPKEMTLRGTLMPTLSVDGRRVVGVVSDEAGTVMVKRYRLVLPGER